MRKAVSYYNIKFTMKTRQQSALGKHSPERSMVRAAQQVVEPGPGTAACSGHGEGKLSGCRTSDGRSAYLERNRVI
jgi:hypothetical protein